MSRPNDGSCYGSALLTLFIYPMPASAEPADMWGRYHEKTNALGRRVFLIYLRQTKEAVFNCS